MIHSVIIVGGSGTRLWPASRVRRPKQMMKVGGPESLLAASYARAVAVSNDVMFVSTELLADVIRQEIPGLPEGSLVLEPEGRDTAACIGLAAYHIVKRDPDGVMLVMPADHLITPVEAFAGAARAAAELAQRERGLVLMGLVPRTPATSFGYIHRGERIPLGSHAAYRVERFREKPDLATAETYLQSGEYYWNSGIFAWRADVILKEFERHLGEHHRLLGEIGDAIGTPDEPDVTRRVYPRIPRISIDYGVIERATNVAVLEADFQWDDVGSWTAFAEHMSKDGLGNAFDGEVLAIDSRDNVFVVPKGKTVTAVGLEGMIVVDTQDALFICPRQRDQDVKMIVDKLREAGRRDLL